MKTITYDSIDASSVSKEVGVLREIYFAYSENGLCRICFSLDSEEDFVQELTLLYPYCEIVRYREGERAADSRKSMIGRYCTALQDYLAGRLRKFDLPIDLSLLTPFQRLVLEATAEVGYGEVTTYGEIARRIRRPKASRAVGNALSRNPVPIVIPCHRVIASDGTLGGYSTGLSFKQALLALEGTGCPRSGCASGYTSC